MGLHSIISRAHNSARFARSFKRETGYTFTLDTLQESIEDGTLLKAYDLFTEENIERYHSSTTTPIGATVAAPTAGGIEHNPVTTYSALDAEDASMHVGSALYETFGGGFARMWGTKKEMRDVAKGLADIYKEYQRVQGSEGRRLEAAEVAAVVDQYQSTATRRTLEFYASELEYLGTETVATVPTASGPTAVVASIAKVSPSAIERESTIKGLAAVPDFYKGAAQEGIMTGAAVAVASTGGIGLAAAYGAFKGAQVASRAVGSGVSYVGRQAASSYTGKEDGWQNGVELTSTLAGLATFTGVVGAATLGSLVFAPTTALLGGAAVATYVGKGHRQKARDTRRQLENALQVGGATGAIETTINDLLTKAKRAEATSTVLKALSLGTLGLGLVGAAYAGELDIPAIGDIDGAPDTEKPTIDSYTIEATNPICLEGDIAFSFEASDNKDIEKVVAELYSASDIPPAASTSVTPIDTITVYEDGPMSINLFGTDTIEASGTFTPGVAGDYKVVLIATDAAGNVVDGNPGYVIDHTFTVSEDNCVSDPDPVPPGPGPIDPVPPGPVPPVPDPVDPDTACDTEEPVYNSDYKDAGWTINREYHDHGTFVNGRYVGGAPHEGALHFDASANKGYVQFDLSKGDMHTSDISNIADDTQIFIEKYSDCGKLEDAFFVDLVANGGKAQFDLGAYDLGENYQIWWADANIDCDTETLCVESIASISKGNYVVEPEIDCDGNTCDPGEPGRGRTPTGPIAADPRPFQLYFTGVNGPHLGFNAESSGLGAAYSYELLNQNGTGVYATSYDGFGSTLTHNGMFIYGDGAHTARIDGVDLGTGMRDFDFRTLDITHATTPEYARPVAAAPLSLDAYESGTNTGSISFARPVAAPPISLGSFEGTAPAVTGFSAPAAIQVPSFSAQPDASVWSVPSAVPVAPLGSEAPAGGLPPAEGGAAPQFQFPSLEAFEAGASLVDPANDNEAFASVDFIGYDHMMEQQRLFDESMQRLFEQQQNVA